MASPLLSMTRSILPSFFGTRSGTFSCMAGCPTSGRPERDNHRYSFSSGSGQLNSILQQRRGLTFASQRITK
jgi:hypothetical protein